MNPYLGITGVVSMEESIGLLLRFPSNSRFKLMLGILMSYKTLMGERNKHPNSFPLRENISSIIVEDKRVLFLIHYSTDFPDNGLADQMSDVISWAGNRCHGFQLNIVWPPPEALERWRGRFPGKVLVLQIGSQAIAMAGDSPGGVVSRLRPYKGFVDAILLDPSGGRGVPMDPQKTQPYLQKLAKANLGMRLGVAGGLGPDSLSLVAPLIKSFPKLSIDAQGKLRTSEDRLDLIKAVAYIQGWKSMMSL